MSESLKQLGDTIRQQRLSLQPQDVGLPAAGRRRGGLSQQEVAVLSGVSTRWLARLEQGQFKAAGHCTQDFIDMLKQDFQGVGLPVDCKVELNKLLKFIRYDKKVSGHRIHFIMPYEPGHVEDELISLNDLYKLAKEAEKKIDE